MRHIDWDIVTFGRALGVVVISLGLALAIWFVVDEGYASDVSVPDKTRVVLQYWLSFLAYGGLLIVAAEIADRLDRRTEDDEGEEAM